MTEGAWILAAAGITAGVLSVVDAIPYLHDIQRGRTRPHRVTWLIWTILGGVAFVSQLADGATWSLWMFGAQALSMGAIFLLSLRRGVGGLTPVNTTMLLLAIAGVAGWAWTSEPVVATGFVVAADAIGFGLMVPKTWRNPWSETRSTYLLAAVSGVLGTVSVGALDPSLLFYPAYAACTDGLMALLITGRRRSVRRPQGWVLPPLSGAGSPPGAAQRPRIGGVEAAL